MLFAEVAETTETVTATRARSTKVAAIADLLTRMDADEVLIVVAILSGAPRQGRIGVGWRTLAKVTAEPAAQPSLTVADVDAMVDRIGSLHGPGSQGARAETLHDTLARATAPEQDLIRRLLGGELRHGALEGIATDAVATAFDVPLAVVRRAAMLAGDLPRVAALAMTEGEAGLAAVGLTLGRPVQPMLAQTAANVTEALALVLGETADGETADGETADGETAGGEAAEGLLVGPGEGLASVEWKLDGARIQLHKVDDRVRIWTRNLNDVTDRLPGIVALARRLPARALVLDGEAVGVGDGDAPEVFQETMSRFGRHAAPPSGEDTEAAVERGGGGEVTGLEARFFDVLHLDGDDLIDRPLAARLLTLEKVAGPWRIRGELTADPAVAQRVLDEALAAGHEGVMVKAAASPYEAGRRGGAWRKVKPVHTLDLVVLAVEWGSGRREGWLSNLHLGARDPEGGFVMVGKTFKGLTDELLTWQTERFLGLETGRSGHVVEVEPVQVVEIALDGVQRSTRYAGGVALRFARVRRYRDDKDAVEADTIATVRAMLHGERSAG